MDLFRVGVTYGLFLGTVVIALTGSLGFALAAAATAAAAIALGAHLGRRLHAPHTHKPAITPRRNP